MISIITDFGFRGQHYIAEMKGVALRINPDLKFIDISHSITPFSVVEASYILSTVYNSLPKNSLVVCVVDPGVGSNRDLVAIQIIDDIILIGPDNGIFSYFANNKLIKLILKITEIEFFNPNYIDSLENTKNIEELISISHTFHGRDIMMPVAAHLSNGLDIFSIGEPKQELDVIFPTNSIISNNNTSISGFIQYIDDFGNIITNLSIIEFKKLIINRASKQFHLIINENDHYSVSFSSIFQGNDNNEILLVEGSSGFIEICQNQRRADIKVNAKLKDSFQITLW